MSPWARGLFWVVGALLLIGAFRFGKGQNVDQRPPDVVPVGVFSEMDPSQTLPEGWTVGSMAAAHKETEYELVHSERGGVVRARSRESTSYLARKCRVVLTEHPVLEWRWKIEDIIEEGNVHVRVQDDAPANLLVTFDYDGLDLLHRLKIVAMHALGYDTIPKRGLIYTWANRASLHTAFPNSQVPWIYQVVVQSGSTDVGTWQTERRNVRADYRRIFGEEPPPVQRVALVTDTESTDGEVTAYYGDIVFRAAPPESSVVDTTLHVQRDE